jgi:hypothetical protein
MGDIVASSELMYMHLETTTGTRRDCFDYKTTRIESITYLNHILARHGGRCDLGSAQRSRRRLEFCRGRRTLLIRVRRRHFTPGSRFVRLGRGQHLLDLDQSHFLARQLESLHGMQQNVVRRPTLGGRE